MLSTTSTSREPRAISVYSFAKFISHIDAFKAALQLDEHDHFGAASNPGTPVPLSPRIRKVSALSDFAPINLKVKRYLFHPCLPIPPLIPVQEEEGRKVFGAQARVVIPSCKVAALSTHICYFSPVTSYSHVSRSVPVVHLRHHRCAVQSLHIHQTGRQHQGMVVCL